MSSRAAAAAIPRAAAAIPRAAAAALGAVVLGLFAPGVAAAQLNPDVEVVQLAFDGNDAFSDGELRTAIVTEETHCGSFLFRFPLPICQLTDWGFAHQEAYLDEEALALDLIRLRLFYRQRGYRDVVVDTTVQRLDGEVAVRFTIEENAATVLGSLEFEGVPPALDTAAMRERFPLEPGERFDLVRVDEGEAEIADRLRGQGYPGATVLREYFIPTGSRRAQLTLHLETGARARIGEIAIEGAAEIDRDVIRRFLTFRPGQYFDQSRILESQRALYNLEALQYANIATARRQGADTLVDVVVQVQPAPTRTLRTGVGLTTTDCVESQASFTHRNFLGGARQLAVSAQLSNILARELDTSFPCTGVGDQAVFQRLNYRIAADFEQPYLFSGGTSLRGSLFLERESVPNLFVRDSRGGEIGITRRLRPRMTATLAWRPEFTNFGEESADIFFCVNYGFCQPDDISLLEESRWLAPVSLSWRYDRTNAAFSPTSGYYARAEFEWAGVPTGSNYHYLRALVEAADFEPVGRGFVLAAHLRFGAVEPTAADVFGTRGPVSDEVVHPRKRFYAGGPQSVRGFGLNLLGPTTLVLFESQCAGAPGETLEACAAALEPPEFSQRARGGNAAGEASLELRMALGRRWSAVGFLDVGQVWADLGDLAAPVASPGIGFRYASPVGPLRVDFGYDLTGPQRLPVVAVLDNGEIRALDTRVRFDPFAYDDPGALREFVRRLQLHLSVGQAF